MADTPRISVALCTHNGARYLPDQLDSIAEQSLPVDELLISDDASRDETVDVVRRFASERRGRTAVELAQNEPALGVTKNFESVLGRVSGDIVFLCDQDDVWRPDKVSALVSRLDAGAAQLVFTDASIVDGKGRTAQGSLFGNLRIASSELSAIEQGRAREVLLRRNVVTGATAATTHRLLEVALPIPESWVHDEWLAIVAAVVGEVRVDRRRLTSYRLHGANEIGATRLDLRAAFGRLTASRTDRNGRLLERARALADRFGADPSVDLEVRDAIRAKLRHEEVRSSYPRGRLRRIRPAFAEWRSGAYARFGLGAQDLLRDILQPV
jgi:glycosyltransferase involved in cell wall biosynthesis